MEAEEDGQRVMMISQDRFSGRERGPWPSLKMAFKLSSQVVEDGYEFFARRQLVTIFSAPNYCGEFDNAGAMMSVDDTLMCSFQVGNDQAKALSSRYHSLPTAPPAPSLHPPTLIPPSSHLVMVDSFFFLWWWWWYLQILKPAEKKQRYAYAGLTGSGGRPLTPPKGGAPGRK